METECMLIKNLSKKICINTERYSSKATNDPITNFFTLKSAKKLKKKDEKIIRRVPKKIALRLIKQVQADEEAAKQVQSIPSKLHLSEPAQVDASCSSTVKKNIIYGPLENFIPSGKSDYPCVTPEPWSSDEIIEYSIKEFTSAVKEWKKLHKAYNDEFGKE